MTKFRKGDRVSLEGTVLSVERGGEISIDVTMTVEERGLCRQEICVHPAALKMVQAGPPAPGDIVVHVDDESLTYTMLATHGEVAWVARAGMVNRFLTIEIKNLIVVERAPVE